MTVRWVMGITRYGDGMSLKHAKPLGVSINGGTPIAGWLILGNLHISVSDHEVYFPKGMCLNITLDY